MAMIAWKVVKLILSITWVSDDNNKNVFLLEKIEFNSYTTVAFNEPFKIFLFQDTFQ